MRKIFHLATCDTNKRIIKELDLKNKNFDFQNIKEKSISKSEIEDFRKHTSSYKELLNTRARKLKEIDTSNFSDDDFKNLILSDYTFLKRPVIIVNNAYFFGNAKKTIEQVKEII